MSRIMEEMTITNSQLMTPVSSQVSLKEMREDPRKYPRVGSIPRGQAAAEMSKIVTQAFLYRGQNVDPTQINFIATALVDELISDPDKMHTGNISFAEVSRVIKRTVMTQDIFLSVSSLYRIIIDYIRKEGSQYQEEIDRARLAKRKEGIRNSVIAPMLQAYAGEMLKKTDV